MAERHCAYHGYMTQLEIEEVLKSVGDWLVCRMQDAVHVLLCVLISQNPLPKIIKLRLIQTEAELVCMTGPEEPVLQKPKKKRAEKVKELVKPKTVAQQTTENKHPEVYSFVSFQHLVKHFREVGLHDGIKLVHSVLRPNWLIPQGCLMYSQDDCLGVGNFSHIFKGRLSMSHASNLRVAVKVVEDCSEEPERTKSRGRLVREALCVRALKNKHIVRCFGVCSDQPFTSIVLELCPGGSLDEHLKRRGPDISLEERLYYLIAVSKGMKHVHKLGYLHRDLATRNCLISSYGQIKLSDFGLSCTVKELENNDANAVILNFPIRWMPPETLSRSPKFSTKCDVWSFGVLMYEVFMNGAEPWPGKTPKEIKKFICHGPMLELPTNMPLQLRVLTSLCWKINSRERPEFDVIIQRLNYQPSSSPDSMPVDRPKFTIFGLSCVNYRDPLTQAANESRLESIIRISARTQKKKKELENAANKKE